MKNICVRLSLIIILVCVIGGNVRVFAISSDMLQKTEGELRAYANENNTWVVCYQQGTRTSDFFQYDATTECLYFSYSKHSCVDVYDINGAFLYSFIFPDRQNGSVCVRCENERIYISTKDNVLYIFEGMEEIDCLDHDEASEKGYDFSWFYNNEPHITVDSTWIRWHNDSVQTVKQINTPAVIKQTIPPSGDVTLFQAVCAAFVVILGLIFMTRIKNKSQAVKGQS